jgi:hypothetical protein
MEILIVDHKWLQQLIAMKGMQVLVQFISHMSHKGEHIRKSSRKLYWLLVLITAS